MGSNKKSTAEKILDLINPLPVSYDPEDDPHEETSAKLVDKFDEDSGESEGEYANQSRLKKNVLLESEDERYKGKKVTRKVLQSGDPGPNESISDVSESFSDEEGKIASDNSEQSSDEDDGSSVDDNDTDVESEEALESDDFQHISNKHVDVEVEKGNCVRNQLCLWDNLLECRIQLQKCVVGANKIPHYKAFDNFVNSGDADFRAILGKCGKNTKALLDKLMTLRETLLESYPETKSLVQSKSRAVKTNLNNNMDEEIPSDTEVEDNIEEDSVKIDVQKAKKRKLEDYSKLLDSQHQEFMQFRNTTIQKWNDKTRIAGGSIGSRNFSTFELSTLKQIEQILSNRRRLLQRTRLKRSAYEILGQDLLLSDQEYEDESNGNELEVNGMSVKSEDKNKEFNTEIFDDTDFYHQLLRELIERKSTDVTDPVQLGRQWIEIQKLRSKMKRKIDVKATKGRRIRYVVHPKLVNFMAPVSDNSWTDEAKSELFSSLFGKSHDKNKPT